MRVWSYELLPDSGGAGEFRGALGVARDVEVLTDDVVFSRYGDRQKHSVPGAEGGGAGKPGRFILNPGSDNMPLKSKGVDALKKGDVVRIETPGGGGFGSASDRDVTALAADLRDGKITEDYIRREFGNERLEALKRSDKLSPDVAAE